MSVIDLSRLPPPNAIEPLDYEALQANFVARFLDAWEDLRALDPTLPAYNVQDLQADPFIVAGQAFSQVRLLDRARVNDAVRACLAPLARGADLDNVVAWANIQRLVIREATDTVPALMESDERLLRRYLLALSRPSAGSADRYVYEALTAWPECHDVAVIGRRVHGRRGDVVILVIGPGGRAPTEQELAIVRAAVTQPDVAPEAVSVSVLPATRSGYDVVMALVIPKGADALLVVAEVEGRIRAAAADRLAIGAEVPRELLSGAGYGPSVIRLSMPTPPADIPPDPYTVRILGTVTLTYEVAT